MAASQTAGSEGNSGAALGLIADHTTDTSAQGIARAISGLITAGTIRPGDQLPTVRTVAAQLGVSSSTVSAAWRLMQNHGVISTNRRRGTLVRSARGSIEGRYWQVPVPQGTLDTDLSTGTPDQALLPDIGVVLHRIHADVAVGSYLDSPVLPDLEAELRRRWPFEPEHITVVDGAQDALDRLIGATVQIGDKVIVEQPTFPPLLDMLELAGAEVIGVELDDEGLRVEALEQAVTSKPSVLILQPRAHNPTGISMSARRARKIAKTLGPDTWVIEDDHSGDAAGVELASISALRPQRSVLIHSYSKSHGPDLRIAAIGGAAAPLRTLERRRSLGPSWTSRLTQQILLEMLTDPNIAAQVRFAAKTYQQRRRDFVSALATHDLELQIGAGLNIAVPVHDEQLAVVYLAAHGIGAAPGRPFLVNAIDQDFVRLSIGNFHGDPVSLAATVAAAARAGIA
ncbi:MAG: DNA-binding transcriptional MocR family regulator [Acidimicrobiales bacterium]|jgi:DNA-binding transcriptional MocR family regulator